MCCYLSTASLMDNGCLGIQGLQFAKASLRKAPLSKSLAASQPGAPTPGTRNCNTDRVSVREKIN